jgi:hypothetical protein
MDEAFPMLYTGHHPPGMTLTRFRDGVIYLVADAGLVLDKRAARELRRQLATVTRRPYVVVSDLRGVPYIDREARVVFADDDDGTVLATAVIAGSEGPIRLLVDRWLADNVVERPVAVFESPDAALAWGHARAADLRAAGKLPGEAG